MAYSSQAWQRNCVIAWMCVNNWFSFALHGIVNWRICLRLGIYILDTVSGTLFCLQNLNNLNIYKVIYQNVENADFNSLFMALSISGFVWDLVDILDTVPDTLFYLQNLNNLNMYKVIYQNVENAGFKLMLYEWFLNTKQNKHF